MSEKPMPWAVGDLKPWPPDEARFNYGGKHFEVDWLRDSLHGAGYEVFQGRGRNAKSVGVFWDYTPKLSEAQATILAQRLIDEEFTW